MNFHRAIQHHRRCRSGWQLVLAVVFSVGLILGQALPTMAGFASNGSGIWVEICSDGEPYLAEIELEDGGTPHECTHCPQCLLWSGNTNLSYTTDSGLQARPDYSTPSYAFDQVKLPTRPEQYWSLSRGPPIPSVESNMIPSVSLFIQGTDFGDFSLVGVS